MTAPTSREELLAKAAQDFIDKVDRGEARSTRSYEAFKAALAAPAQGCVNPNGILADIVQRWNDLKRDEGAFPPGDRRAAMSEHRLWHAIQAAKAWLSAFPSTDAPAQGTSSPEAMGRAYYLARYEKDGANWEANDHKMLWIRMAQRYHELLGSPTPSTERGEAK